MEITTSQLATLGVMQNKLNVPGERIGVKFRVFVSVYTSGAGRINVEETVESAVTSTSSIAFFSDDSGIDDAIKFAWRWIDDRAQKTMEVYETMVQMRAVRKEARERAQKEKPNG